MKAITRIRKEAEAAAMSRGHKLHPWHPLERDRGRGVVFATCCRVCFYGVAIDAEPAPNGIEVAGRAVALNCPGKPDL